MEFKFNSSLPISNNFNVTSFMLFIIYTDINHEISRIFDDQKFAILEDKVA